MNKENLSKTLSGMKKTLEENNIPQPFVAYLSLDQFRKADELGLFEWRGDDAYFEGVKVDVH